MAEDMFYLLKEEKIETEKISETHENGSVNGLAVGITANGLEVDGESHVDFLCPNTETGDLFTSMLDGFLGLDRRCANTVTQRQSLAV